MLVEPQRKQIEFAGHAYEERRVKTLFNATSQTETMQATSDDDQDDGRVYHVSADVDFEDYYALLSLSDLNVRANPLQRSLSLPSICVLEWKSGACYVHSINIGQDSPKH